MLYDTEVLVTQKGGPMQSGGGDASYGKQASEKIWKKAKPGMATGNRNAYSEA